MTKREFTNIMRMWEKKNEKVNARAKAMSIETAIENEIAYSEDVAMFTSLASEGCIRTGYNKSMFDI